MNRLNIIKHFNVLTPFDPIIKGGIFFMRNKLRLLTVCIMLLFISTQLYSFNEMDRQIGIIYLKNAAAFYLNGNYARSLDYLG